MRFLNDTVLIAMLAVIAGYNIKVLIQLKEVLRTMLLRLYLIEEKLTTALKKYEDSQPQDVDSSQR